MRVHWIWLANCPAVNDRVRMALLRHFRDPEDIYFADDGAFDHIEGISPEAKQALRDKDLGPSERILEACHRERIQILTYRDAAYPTRLKNIPDPPAVLYYKGQLPEFDALPVIGVVGTRRASAYGMNTAKRLGYQIARCGGLVVSGMAEGIDTMAMNGAMTGGQKAAGVLGCGVDVVYPQRNRSLYRDVEAYGCILSEYPPGTQPAKWTFPRRNRIISGLSNGVLVVEAPEKSGALITASLAAEQGRDVFAVPGNIDQASCVGSNRLLRDGAMVVSSGWDILCEYQAQYPDKIRKEEAGQAVPGEALRDPAEGEQKRCPPPEPENLKKEFKKKSIDKERPGPYSDVNNGPLRLSGDEQRILAALSPGERLVDDLIAETGLPSGKLLAGLTMLELKGAVRRAPGKRIVLTAPDWKGRL